MNIQVGGFLIFAILKSVSVSRLVRVGCAVVSVEDLSLVIESPGREERVWSAPQGMPGLFAFPFCSHSSIKELEGAPCLCGHLVWSDFLILVGLVSVSSWASLSGTCVIALNI